MRTETWSWHMAVDVDIIIINQSKFQKLLLRLLSEVNRLKLQTKMRTGNYFVLLGFHGKFLLLGRLRKLSEIFSLLTIEIIFTYFHLRLHLAFLQSQTIPQNISEHHLHNYIFLPESFLVYVFIYVSDFTFRSVYLYHFQVLKIFNFDRFYVYLCLCFENFHISL